MKLEQERSDRAVGIWMLTGVLMIIVQIVLGGITRLTDSGLSITEWRPILGTIPPTTADAWHQAFEKYKQIAQYKQIHFYFTLEDFKSIYFWEWLHRNWGKLLGVAFLIPFLIFLKQGRLRASMIRPFIILFILGGLQGLVGWIMVRSGLNEENIYVSHIRLAIHFLMALLLLVYCFWFALRLLVPNENTGHQSGRQGLIFLLVLLVIQLAYGAFMAGLRAAITAYTWPDINGSYVPDFQHFLDRTYTGASALINNPLAVQFIHRNLAYLITLFVIVWTLRAARQPAASLYRKTRWLPLVLVVIQVILGVASILTSPQHIPQKWGVFEWNALSHQFVAMLLLLSIVLNLFLSRPYNRVLRK